MRAAAQRVLFLLLAAVMTVAAAKISPVREAAPPEEPANYVYSGYAAATDAPWDEKSLDFAVYRFSHLLETYFTGDYRCYLSVIPDKAQFTQPPKDYTPADASDTLSYLADRLPVTAIDIAGLLSLEDYYRTDSHWRQENLTPVAQALAAGMGVSLPDSGDDSLHALEGDFCGSFWGKTAETLTPDTLAYLTGEVLDRCTVYDYETGETAGIYDYEAAKTAPFDLFLSGSKSLLRIDDPAAETDRTLIVFRDSFGSSLVPLLTPGYATIYVVDIRYLATDALSRVVEFPDSADVLLLYSTTVLHNSITLK